MQTKRHIIDRWIEERSHSILMTKLHEVMILHEVLIFGRSQGIRHLAHINPTNLNVSHHRLRPRLALAIRKSVIADI